MPSEEDGSITCWIDQLRRATRPPPSHCGNVISSGSCDLPCAKLPPALRAVPTTMRKMRPSVPSRASARGRPRADSPGWMIATTSGSFW